MRETFWALQACFFSAGSIWHGEGAPVRLYPVLQRIQHPPPAIFMEIPRPSGQGLQEFNTNTRHWIFSMFDALMTVEFCYACCFTTGCAWPHLCPETLVKRLTGRSGQTFAQITQPSILSRIPNQKLESKTYSNA